MSNSITPNLDDYRPHDAAFGRPFIDRDEAHEQPVPHRYIHGGFNGNHTRFSFYLPNEEKYRGRVLQYLEGGSGGNEHLLSANIFGPGWYFNFAHNDKGRELVIADVKESVLLPFGQCAPELFSDVETGDEVTIDNRDWLAFTQLYKHLIEKNVPELSRPEAHVIPEYSAFAVNDIPVDFAITPVSKNRGRISPAFALRRQQRHRADPQFGTGASGCS